MAVVSDMKSMMGGPLSIIALKLHAGVDVRPGFNKQLHHFHAKKFNGEVEWGVVFDV